MEKEKLVKSWAENEVEIACKKENPNWDGKTFDYGCSCYKSALNAYKKLENDKHSGCSWNITKNILIRLLNNLPLSPITEEDFNHCDDIASLKKENLISLKQCSRMSSLFRSETINGEIFYSDIDRVYCTNILNNNDKFSCKAARDIIDKLYPITMPYNPIVGKYNVFVETFLTDKNNGDFDTHGFLYVITPENKKVELNIFEAYEDEKTISLTKEQYEERKKKAIHF